MGKNRQHKMTASKSLDENVGASHDGKSGFMTLMVEGYPTGQKGENSKAEQSRLSDMQRRDEDQKPTYKLRGKPAKLAVSISKMFSIDPVLEKKVLDIADQELGGRRIKHVKSMTEVEFTALVLLKLRQDSKKEGEEALTIEQRKLYDAIRWMAGAMRKNLLSKNPAATEDVKYTWYGILGFHEALQADMPYKAVHILMERFPENRTALTDLLMEMAPKEEKDRFLAEKKKREDEEASAQHGAQIHG